jgi:hypothetical protein
MEDALMAPLVPKGAMARAMVAQYCNDKVAQPQQISSKPALKYSGISMA